MSLYQQIQDDVKTAMKAKDLQTLDVLRLLSSSIKNKMIEFKKELDDAEVVAIIRSDVKKLKEASKEFAAGARQDLVDKTEAEVEILKKYLPQEMSQEELDSKVEAIIGEKLADDVKDIGRAMGVVMADLKGLVDGNRVREAVSRILSDKS
mgnify:CR=1 FL=1